MLLIEITEDYMRTCTHARTYTHKLICKSFETGISYIKCTQILILHLRVCLHNIHCTDRRGNTYFIDMINDQYVNHMKYTNTLYGQFEESFTVKTCGTYNLWANND